ncbi:hypothetical protein BDW67DRAFT_31897 [Aspergillus spinulosporus]
MSIGALLLYSCNLAQPNAFGPMDDVRDEVAEQLVIMEQIKHAGLTVTQKSPPIFIFIMEKCRPLLATLILLSAIRMTSTLDEFLDV